MGKSRPSTAFKYIAEAIGAEAARLLAAQLGGHKLYVPKDIEADHIIAKAIGSEAAAKLSDYFFCTWIEVPTSKARRQLAMELLNEGKTRQAVSRLTGYSERHLYNLAHAPDDRQADLFGAD